MNYIELVNDVLYYIEMNLKRNISIDELCEKYYLSKYYFIRIFKALTNQTIKEYIDKRRISEAAKLLSLEQNRVVDIAFEYGFESHEVFTRRFKKMFSITPMEYKQKKHTLNLYERIEVIERDFKNLRNNVVVDFETTQLRSFMIYGKKTHFNPNSNQSILKLLPFTQQFVLDYIEPKSIDHLYNVMGVKKNNQYDFFVGYHASTHSCHDDLEAYEIPKSKYAIFKYYEDLSSIHQTAMNDICRSIVISEISMNKLDIEFFVLFNKDYELTKEYLIYVPVK